MTTRISLVILTLAGLAASIGPVECQAAALFSEDFSNAGALPGPNLVQSSGPGASFNGSNATFAGVGSRSYLRTIDTDYSTTDFSALTTVTIPGGQAGWGLVFFGMGTGEPDGGFYGEPRTGSHIYMRPGPDDFGGGGVTITDNTVETVASADLAGNGTHRLRMDWDSTAQQMSYYVHQDYTGGPFVPSSSFAATNGADNGFDATNSRIFLGGANGAAFDDFEVTSLQPTPPRPGITDSYSRLVDSDNPYGYWRFNESSTGDPAVNSGSAGTALNGNYGQFAPPDGVPTVGAAGIPGAAGNTAAEFSGSSPVSQVYIPDLVHPTAYTIEAWVKADAGATTARNIMVRTSGNPTATFSHQLRLEPSGHPMHYSYSSTGAKWLDGNAPAQADEWYHIVGTATNAGHFTTYVNGELQKEWSGNMGTLWNGGNQWRIGSIAGGGDWFDGVIDEVAIYHEELSAQQIWMHYRVGAVDSQQQPLMVPTRTLDLADVVGGGNGSGNGTFDAGINPGTGELIAAGTANPGTVTGPGYHTVALDYVDGVWIPGVNAGGQMQIDSTGTTVGYPNRDARSWGYLRNGPTGGVSTVLGGVDYATEGHSLIGAHANKGVTFDLDAIRAANPGMEVGQFTTTYGKVTGAGGNIDFNVYLDGRLMYGIGGNLTAGTPIQVGISANDRFLTLVASDGGDTYSYDQVIFGDPQLELGRNLALGKPVSAWAYYTGAGGFPAYNLTDGDLNDQYPGDAQGRSFWLGPDGQTGDVIVDLVDTFTIDRVDLQNSHNGGYHDRGVEDFTLLVSTDGASWSEVTTGTLTQFVSSGAIQNIPVESFMFDPIDARFVKLQIDSIHGASAGLNEIRVYSAVPEPGTLALALLGLLGLAAVARRKRNRA